MRSVARPVAAGTPASPIFGHAAMDFPARAGDEHVYYITLGLFCQLILRKLLKYRLCPCPSAAINPLPSAFNNGIIPPPERGRPAIRRFLAGLYRKKTEVRQCSRGVSSTSKSTRSTMGLVFEPRSFSRDARLVVSGATIRRARQPISRGSFTPSDVFAVVLAWRSVRRAQSRRMDSPCARMVPNAFCAGRAPRSAMQRPARW